MNKFYKQFGKDLKVIDGFISTKKPFDDIDKLFAIMKHFRSATRGEFVFRGQSSSKWHIQSTLRREMHNSNIPTSHRKFLKFKDLLDFYKYSCRSRLSEYPEVKDTEENEKLWWAFGRHYGLPAPIIDFTRSPYVALFFAFAQKGIDSENRCIYAIDTHELARVHQKLLEKMQEDIGENRTVEFFTPLHFQNHRLVAQNGLFLYYDGRIDFEEFLVSAAKDHGSYFAYKINISNSLRKEILLALEQMNITPLTLFPDVDGVVEYAKLGLEITDYGYFTKDSEELKRKAPPRFIDDKFEDVLSDVD